MRERKVDIWIFEIFSGEELEEKLRSLGYSDGEIANMKIERTKKHHEV